VVTTTGTAGTSSRRPIYWLPDPELTSTLIAHRFAIEDAVEAFRLAQDV
jgi:hypothetical protein